MKRKVEVLQNGFKDCGASCLLSIMRYYGSNASHEELTFLLKTTNNGTSAYNIIDGAKKLGFNGYGIKYTYDEIISSNVILPIIAHVEKYNMYHFIVLYEINTNKKSIKVMDPEVGLTSMSYNEFKKIYLNTAVVIYPVKRLQYKENKKIFEYLNEYLKQDYKVIKKIIIMSILIVLLALLSNYATKIIVDNLLINYEYEKIIYFSLTFLSIMFVKSILSFIRNNILIDASNKISINMLSDMFYHILNLPYYFFKNKSTGEVISRINDLKEFKEILSDYVINVFMDMILIIFSMLILMILNIKMFIVVVLSMIIYLLIVLIFSKRIKNSINEVQIENGHYNQVITESVEGYETNKNINMTNYIAKKINLSFIKYSYKNKCLEYLINNQTLLKDIVMSVSNIIIMLIGIVLISKNKLSLGDYLLFNTIMIYFTEPIKNILDLEPNISHIKGIYNRINDLLLVNSKDAIDTDTTIKGDIIIDNLSYSYNNYDVLFKNINFKINYGSKHLLYGNSGSGKSTILKILLKYLDDYGGRILINNRNIKDIDSNIISSSFTYVSQNSYLNNDTLKNNIIYDRQISDENYENIINICHVNKIRDDKLLRDNYMVEENGFNLSGGERQKIVLARSLLKESNYIILDEALSEVGFEEEKIILNKIISYFKDKTIIYISHKKEIIDLFTDKYYLERSMQ